MKHGGPGSGFRRRIYDSPAQCVRDLRQIGRLIRPVLELSTKAGIAASFRERIMLVVTGVNRCRHCAQGHQLVARHVGLSQAEISALLSLDLADCPEHELPGLQFAMHWAESDGSPSADARSMLDATYGAGVARQIEAATLMIHVGNRVGNSFDYALSRISRGRFGLLASER